MNGRRRSCEKINIVKAAWNRNRKLWKATILMRHMSWKKKNKIKSIFGLAGIEIDIFSFQTRISPLR